MKFLVYVLFLISFAICYVDADCGIVPKKQWGGLGATKVEYLPRPISLVIIQHTATPRCDDDAACKDRIRNIQDYHMDTLQFWDIGPSFLVGAGKVYEGSGWLHVGAHTYGYNRKSIAISFIGNYNNYEPTKESIKAVKDLLKCGVERGHLTSDYKLIGHKQVLATESPGRYLYNDIRRWPHFLENADSIKVN